jgi:YD repeat-containing protein
VVTRYLYDENNNKIEEEIVGSGKLTLYSYDLGNRLVKKEEKYEGRSSIWRYAYNALNQLIAEKDPYGQVSSYTYDRLGNQIKAVQPKRLDDAGNIITPTARQHCNLLGHPIKKSDENGSVTCFSYNIYGSPTKIIYPDNHVERFTYYPSGWLKQKWNEDKTSCSYCYDPKGRLIKETTLDSNDSPIKVEEYTYRGPLLLTKKDAMGVITNYEYDGAGRKTAEIVNNGKITRYSYDDFGRVSKVFRALDQELGQYEIYEYDALGRLLSKSREDSEGVLYAKETYSYDAQGNQIKRSYLVGKEKTADYLYHYNPDGTLCWKEDPLNQRTSYSYNHNERNSLKQRVCSRDTIDPLGRIHREILDVYQLPEKQMQLSAEGKILSCKEYGYDAIGNTVRVKVAVMNEGLPIREYTLLRNYTASS